MSVHSFFHRQAALLAAFALFLCTLPVTAGAASPDVAYVVGAGGNMTKVVQATPLGDTSRASSLQRAINANLSLLPFVSVVDARGIPGGASIASASKEGIDFKKFGMGADMVITANWLDRSQVELRCFEVTAGRFMFGNRYSVGGSEEELADVADKFCADFLDTVIGSGAFFRSTMAFVKSGGERQKDVWGVRPNGRKLTRLSGMKGEALSPTWSPDGRKVLFTHIDKRSHALGVYDSATKTSQRIKFPGNTVIGPSYMPDGRVAVSLTDGRNPSIFLLSQGLQKERKLDSSSAIDVSPSVDASGSLMAFTSNRLGNPHVFLKDLRSGAVRRVTTAGNYNTEPSISPDGTFVAFSRREAGGHRIFVQDLVTGAERQVSFGPGSDEEPAFSPDSYFIAFVSNRGGKKGIFLTTRNGGDAKELPTGSGDASFPAWGPATR